RRLAGTPGSTPSRSRGRAGTSAWCRRRFRLRGLAGRAGTSVVLAPLLRRRPRRQLEATLEEHVQSLVGADLAQHQLEPRREEQAMGDDGQEERLDVVRHDVVAPVEERPAAGCLLERKRRPDGCAEVDDVELARGADEPDGPALQDVPAVDALDRVLETA